MKQSVVILGGGVCGLYAGITAARLGNKVTLIEKRSGVGGLAAGKKIGENYCDYGVHMLHAFDKEIFEDVASIMGEERLKVALDARIKWGGKSLRYPLKSGDMLGAMPLFSLSKCVLGVCLAEIGRSLGKGTNDKTAEDALITFYGAPLYEYFFEEFTERYWGIHPRLLSAEFVKRKMPRLSIVDTVSKMLGFKRRRIDLVEGAMDEETLHYASTGAEAMVRCLRAEFEKMGGVVMTDTILKGVVRSEFRVSQVECEQGGEFFRVDTDQLISTIPIPSLVNALDLPNSVINIAAELAYKPITMYAVLVRKAQCMDGLYTYYRNRIFHRVGEPKNAGMEIKPDGASLLICEMTCEVGDERWNGEVKSEVLEDLKNEGLCVPDDVIEIHQLHYQHGYPVYELGFEKKLEVIQSELEKIENLQSIGRQGAFIYPAMHTSMRIGKQAAEAI